MKTKLFLGLMASLFSLALTAQEMPLARAVDRSYRGEYKKALKAETATVDRLQAEGWDFYLPLAARVPESVSGEGIDGQAIDHWGKLLLLPEALRSRIEAECTYSVIAKVSDTGVDSKHPELDGAWWLTASDYTGDPRPFQLHGTHVAGTAFSFLDILAKKGRVLLKDVRVLNGDGAGSWTWAANMLSGERAQDEQMIEAGAYVIYNFSWGGTAGTNQALEAELKKSAEKGVLFVGAAGNAGPGERPSYPAASVHVLAVASLDQNLQVSSYSTRGAFVHAAMPGRAINSTVPGGGFAVLSGTSMASPMLFAGAVIAKSKYGPRIPDGPSMEKYLAAVASDLAPDGWDAASGWGIVYFQKILDTRPEDVIATPPPPPPPPPPVETLTTVTVDLTGVMRWRTTGTTTNNTLQLSHIRVMHTGKGLGDVVHDRLWEWAATFFKNRVIILPADMSAPEAVYWTGRFMEIVAAQQGLRLDVLEATGIDERGRTFYSLVNDTLPKGFDGGDIQTIIEE